MLKAIAIARVTKSIVKEVRKYNLSVSIDKPTAKVTLVIQKKK